MPTPPAGSSWWSNFTNFITYWPEGAMGRMDAAQVYGGLGDQVWQDYNTAKYWDYDLPVWKQQEQIALQKAKADQYADFIKWVQQNWDPNAKQVVIGGVTYDVNGNIVGGNPPPPEPEPKPAPPPPPNPHPIAQVHWGQKAGYGGYYTHKFM